MDPTGNSRSSDLPDSVQPQRELRDLEGAQDPISEAGEVEARATTSGGVSVGDMLSSPQVAQGASSAPIAMGSGAGAPSGEASGNHVREVADVVFFSQNLLNRKVVSLVSFFLLKYRLNQTTTKAEILESINCHYEVYYLMIFNKASDCMWLLFGIDVMEVDPLTHTYVLVTALGITYDGLDHGVPGIPKTGLVIVLLSIIFVEDNCVSEEVLWRLLNFVGLYAGREHFLYGEPRSLITEHFVQEGYLRYRQVANSDPPRHEFLWGPRAHAETTKMKVLMFFASVVRQDPRSFPFWYAEALWDLLDRV